MDAPRREALVRLLSFVAGIPLLGVASLIGVRFLLPTSRKRTVSAVVARASELPRRAPLRVEGILGRSLLLRRDGHEILAFSTACPHMGCEVGWHEGTKEFVCPCHSARFDATGTPLSGPVSQPLSRFPAREREGLIIVELPAPEEI